MGDFGRIFEQWESMQESRSAGRRADARHRLEQALDAYPVIDKDATLAEDDSDAPEHPERLPVEDRTDLHGLTVEEALAQTDRFIASAVARGLRKVVIIHGKGRSPDGRDGEGRLKREVRAYLERDRRTGAMGYARGADGGRGALWVIVRSGPTVRGR